MADQVIMLLYGYSVTQSAMANQFLIDTGLDKDLRLVLAEYEEEVELHSVGTLETRKAITTKTCLGFEALTEKAAFYWTLKGTKELHRRLKEYDWNNRGKL